MMKNKIFILTTILLGMVIWRPAQAQQQIGEGLEIDKTVHNFGDIIANSGPVSCTFTITNNSNKPAVIYNVASSCGCTNVKWTREPIRPGEKGTISATYSNDEGAYPFDKNLTVYISGIKKPIILKLRGAAMAKQLPLSERYPVKFGPLGVKAKEIKSGNLDQGEQKSGTIKVANLSKAPVTVSFSGTTPELLIKVSPNPIPAESVSDLNYTIKSSRTKWGKNYYKTKIITDGKVQPDELSFWGFTKENFDDLTREQKSAGANPLFENSTYSFGKVRKGTIVHAEYSFKNIGKTDFKIYKLDNDKGQIIYSPIPETKPGEKTSFSIDLDTTSMQPGEALAVVTLTTNSPLRPIINIFIAGWLE